MKIRITGASTFVNRMFEACGNYQWAREFLKNALEAGATKVEFGIEWQAVANAGVYRRTVADDGSGMDRQELLDFFSTLGAGAKKMGGVHDNFGVGAKIASLPWNPEGVVVVSYKNAVASMIWIMLDEESGDYELVEFEKPSGEKECVIEPQELEGVDWRKVRPDWLHDHGTVIVLLGSEQHQDTVRGNPSAGETDIKGLSVYLNSRFWDLSSAEVRVVELRSERKAQWPSSPDDRDDMRRPNNRQIRGARHYLVDVKSDKGRLAASGTELLDEDRVSAEWYLWEGERPAIHSYAKRSGYIAVRYKGELFELTAAKPHYRWFGVVEGKVQQNLWLILEPQHYDSSGSRWGVHPDQSRNRLNFTGNGNNGAALPLSEWGLEFAESMPAEVRAAIQGARGELSGSIDDEEYRKRLQERFGSRWSTKALVKARKASDAARPAVSTGENVDIVPDFPDIDTEADTDPARPRRPRRNKKTIKLLGATAGGAEFGIERDRPVDVPKYRLARGDSFDKPWHLAVWVPNDPEGPTVLINTESPILEDVVRYHEAQYPDVYAEEVGKTVRAVFGEVAACKIAHSQRLARSVPLEELDADYRSEKALTVALMGLLAEETVIAQRLGRLGRKKPTTKADEQG